MKIAFPIGSTALLLLLLALVAQFKGGALLLDAVSGIRLESNDLDEASKQLADGAYARSLQASSHWFMVRNVLLGLGFLLGLYWFRLRQRSQYKSPIPVVKPSGQPYRRDRRRRR
jgi:hypothetical protein